MGRVTTPQLAIDGPCQVRVWTRDATNTLHETERTMLYDGSGGLRRCRCWWRPELPVVHERRDWQNTMTPRKHTPPPAWRWGGYLDEPGVDPTEWIVRGHQTLREPVETLLCQLQNRDVYAALVSRLFTLEGDACAFPRAFEPGAPWHELLDGANESERLAEVRKTFAPSGRTEAMTRAVRQTVWQVRTCGLSVGFRNGGDGLCPIEKALGRSVPDTHTQAIFGNPTAELVWIHVLEHAWADAPYGMDFGSLRGMKRAVLGIGYPQPLGSLAEPFALLCALVLHHIVKHRHAVSQQLERPGPRPAYDVISSAATIYETVRLAFAHSISGERARHQLLERQMRRAGLPELSCSGPHGPMQTFRQKWIHSGVGIESAGTSVMQTVLPEVPPGDLELNLIGRRRFAVRPDRAPPTAMPVGCRQVYISTRADGQAWALAVIEGGDGQRDEHGTHAVETVRALEEQPRGREEPHVCALVEALCAALDTLCQSTAPAVIRMPVGDPSCERARMLVAGAWTPSPPLYARQRSRAAQQWSAASAHAGGMLWLAGFDPRTRYAWGERVAALAAAHGHQPADDPDTACPVCLESYTDLLPTPDPQSRAPPGGWNCPHGNPNLQHAVCRECDAGLEGRATRCPICRGARTRFMPA